MSTAVDSPGAQLIIEESIRDDAAPLFVSVSRSSHRYGISIVARARDRQRESYSSMDWRWASRPLGGYFIEPEFNLSNDIRTRQRRIFLDLNVWQVPMSTYSLMSVGYAELYEKVPTTRRTGWLPGRPTGRVPTQKRSRQERSVKFWSLGDSPAVGILINPNAGSWAERPAPGFQT